MYVVVQNREAPGRGRATALATGKNRVAKDHWEPVGRGSKHKER
jgi:hypothetical protein